MELESFKAFHLQIPFRYSYEHNLAKRLTTDTVILELVDTGGVKVYGEATPRSYVTGESSKQLIADLPLYLPQVLERFDGQFESIEDALLALPGNLLAMRSLIEGALLNWISAVEDKTLFDIFNIQDDQTLIYSAPITSGSTLIFEKMVRFFSANNMTRIKLKLTPDREENIQRVHYIKEHFPGDIDIRVDGNEIWSYQNAQEQMGDLINLGVSCFEQIFHRDDKSAYQKAYENWGDDCQLIVDESITDHLSCDTIINASYLHGANLKICKNGGILNALSMADRLRDAGKTVRLGAHVGEASLLTLQGIIFASRFKDQLDIDGAFGDYLLQEDPFSPSLKFGAKGKLKVDSEFRAASKLVFTE